MDHIVFPPHSREKLVFKNGGQSNDQRESVADPAGLKLLDFNANPVSVLLRYCTDPRLLPRLPESKRMTLVGVVELPAPEQAELKAYLIDSPEAAYIALQWHAETKIPFVFFRVPIDSLTKHLKT